MNDKLIFLIGAMFLFSLLNTLGVTYIYLNSQTQPIEWHSQLTERAVKNKTMIRIEFGYRNDGVLVWRENPAK